MNEELRVLISEPEADAERLAALGTYLRSELLQTDVANVVTLRTGEPPHGARAGDASTVGGLLVNLGRSAEGLQSVISVIKAWLGRGRGAGRIVRLELAGDVLELSQASVLDQDRLVDLFIRRNAVREGEPWTASGKP